VVITETVSEKQTEYLGIPRVGAGCNAQELALRGGQL
jgi:hypothetical protein